MSARSAILQALLEGALVELMVKTNVENVMVEGDITLAAKLAEMVASLNGKDTPAQRDAAIQTAIDGLIAGAPGTYDTLKEIADYITTHQSAADALTAAIGDKADKKAVADLQTTINGLGALAKKSQVSETDLDTALKDKVNAAAQGNHAHDNKVVLDGITAENVKDWNGKGRFHVSQTRPQNLKEGDLWAKVT